MLWSNPSTVFVPTPETEGRIDELPFLAGQGVGLIHEVMPVAHIIDNMMGEAALALSALPTGSGNGRTAATFQS